MFRVILERRVLRDTYGRQDFHTLIPVWHQRLERIPGFIAESG